MSVRAYLGLGSNLRSPMRQIHQTMHLLRTLPRTVVKKKSPCYRSQAYGRHAQPAFCNAAVLVETTLSSQQLLRYCLKLEKKRGRVRKKHWGTRIIDIDLLLYAHKTQKTSLLTLPHPGITQRDFVLTPLLAITPNLTMPSGQSLTNALHALSKCYITTRQHTFKNS